MYIVLVFMHVHGFIFGGSSGNFNLVSSSTNSFDNYNIYGNTMNDITLTCSGESSCYQSVGNTMEFSNVTSLTWICSGSASCQTTTINAD